VGGVGGFLGWGSFWGVVVGGGLGGGVVFGGPVGGGGKVGFSVFGVFGGWGVVGGGDAPPREEGSPLELLLCARFLGKRTVFPSYLNRIIFPLSPFLQIRSRMIPGLGVPTCSY